MSKRRGRVPVAVCTTIVAAFVGLRPDPLLHLDLNRPVQDQRQQLAQVGQLGLSNKRDEVVD
jgi:hypothetical protein